MAVRVLHRVVSAAGETDALTAYVHRARDEPGCREAEHYRSLDDGDRVVVTELWDDAAAFAGFTTESEGPAAPLLRLLAAGGADTGTEVYQQCRYTRAGGVWTPEDLDPAAPAVSWPATGQVRALIAVSSRPTPENPWPGGREGVLATRREPGCLQFEVFAGAEFAQDGIVLERWQDQAHYDAHWRLRMAVRAAAARDAASSTPAPRGPAPEPRGHGRDAVEFYRLRDFVHLYDRWLPAGHADRADTVVWPH